jgi:tRNA (mo5U34)-methyltransferase
MLTKPQKLLIEENQKLLKVLPLKKQLLLSKILEEKAKKFNNPNVTRFYKPFVSLPNIESSFFEAYNQISIGDQTKIPLSTKTKLAKALLGLKPWRKGPYNIFGIEIDSEWRSDFKWDRIKDNLPDLKNKKVLDIGCSSGYYMFRMLEHQPKIVIGIDPSDLFFFQFHALQKYAKTPNIFYCPIKVEEATMFKQYFDVVFCMGILYHRKNPLEALREFKNLLNKNGEIILETLIIEGKEDISLSPYPSYAKMNNAYHIPTIPCLINWLKRTGFKDIKIISKNYTSTSEQRNTAWVDLESLPDFLDPKNSNHTIEGYPRPLRVTLKAK